MAPQAEKGLSAVIDYLEKEWSFKEILNLEQNIIQLIDRIVEYPDSCPKSTKKKTLYKRLVDKNNYIIYRVNYQTNCIEIIK